MAPEKPPKGGRDPGKPRAELNSEERRLLEEHLRRYPPRPKGKPGRRRPPAPRLTTMARRGSVPVDASLDLHGRTLAEATALVERMLGEAGGRGWRYLRIVTGKGLRSPGGQAVLAEEIPALLRRDPRVAEIVQAVRPRDGGAGAWFVRLRVR